MAGRVQQIKISSPRVRRHFHPQPPSDGPLFCGRIIDVGLRPFPTGESPGCILSQGGGHGQAIDFDAFVCFFLCEEALRTETCSERDIRYCFALVDETGKGRIGTQDIVPFYKDAVSVRLCAILALSSWGGGGRGGGG